MMPIHQVLDLARWAPSGDNTQPWRFVISAPDRVLVLGHDTRDTCVYDLDGHASQISIGALLENIDLAATRFGLRTRSTCTVASTNTHPVFEVLFERDTAISEHPLVHEIDKRTVQRRPLSTRPLSAEHKTRLQEAVGDDYRVCWFDTPAQRRQMAWLNFVSARIRLTIPEAYAVHSKVIEWDAVESVDRIPSAALGASGGTLVMMRWAMASWRRVSWMNRFLAGTLMPRVELELVPGIACAAHAVLIAPNEPSTLADYVSAGRALQRFWLAASAAGLQFQPGYTPLVFARYARDRVRFTSDAQALHAASDVGRRIERLLGAEHAHRAVFMGRIGYGRRAQARSTRLPLADLIQPEILPEAPRPRLEREAR